MPGQPRDARNNNPGNVRKNPKNKWQGLTPDQPDPEFCTFISIPYGIRAMARVIIAYQDHEGLNTVEKIINKWAPPLGNTLAGAVYTQNTSGYARRVVTYMNKSVPNFNLTVDSEIDVHDYVTLRALLEGMINVEAAADWETVATDSQMTKGLVLAGVEPPQQSLASSRTIKGQQVASASVATIGLTDYATHLQYVQDQLQPLVDYSQYIKYAFCGVAFLGIGLTVYAKIDNRRKGIA